MLTTPLLIGPMAPGGKALESKASRASLCNRERTPRSTHGLAAFTHRFGGG